MGVSFMEGRFSRQADMFHNVSNLSATIIGCGASGSHIARLLAATGFKSLRLIDPQNVGEENEIPGMFYPNSANRNLRKVDSVAALCLSLNPDLKIEKVVGEYAGSDVSADFIFVCTDTLYSRKYIAEQLNGNYQWYVDLRIGGPGAEGYFISPDKFEIYRLELDTKHEVNLPCGEKATTFVSSALVQYVGTNIYRYCNGLPLHTMFLFDARWSDTTLTGVIK